MAKLTIHYTNAAAKDLPLIRGWAAVVLDPDNVLDHPNRSTILALSVPEQIFDDLRQYLFQRGKFLWTRKELRADMKQWRAIKKRSAGHGF